MAPLLFVLFFENTRTADSLVRLCITEHESFADRVVRSTVRETSPFISIVSDERKLMTTPFKEWFIVTTQAWTLWHKTSPRLKPGASLMAE